MRLDEVLHHVHERFVAAAKGIEHHLPQHMQNVGTLGIDQKLISSAGLAAAQPVTLSHWSNRVWLDVMRCGSGQDDPVTPLFPKFNIFVLIAQDLLDVK